MAVIASALALAAMFCLQMGQLTCSAWRAVLRPGPASSDQAIAALAGSAVLALAGWLIGALTLSLLASLASRSSAVGARLAALARLVAPALLRNTVAAILGVAIAAAPLTANAATHPAGLDRPLQSQQVKSDQAGLSPSWVPLRASPSPAASQVPATARDARSPAHPADPAPASISAAQSRSDLAPGWIPTQPASGRRPSAPASSLATVASTPRRASIEPDEAIVVRRGDTLWALAARQLGPGATDAEIALEWPHWFTANRAVVGRDPDHLTPGERLRAPDPAGSADREAGR